MVRLRRKTACGIVKRVPTQLFGPMRLLSLIVRTSMRAAIVLVLVLLAVSTAEAARGPRKTAAPRRVCDPQTTTLKQLKRQPHVYGGPVAPPSQLRLVGLTDPTTRIARATETDDDDDGEAIQNDAPATQIDTDQHVTVLTPLGLLVRSVDSRLCTHTFAPKSPRGPPLDVD
jgi:hypothetical protein